MNTAIIYTMTFASGASYVGATHSFACRRCKHRREMRKGQAVNRLVQREFDAHGVPTFAAVASLLPGSELHELEAAVIASLAPSLNVQHPTPISRSRMPKPPKEKGVPPSPKPWGSYPSVGEAARQLGLCYRTAKRWARVSGTPEEAIAHFAVPKEPPCVFVGPKKPQGVIQVRGVVGFPLALIARFGLTESSYRRNIRSGLSQEQAVIKATAIHELNNHPKLLTANGTTMHMSAWCRETGINHATLLLRLRSGWTPEQALNLAPRPDQTRMRPKKHFAVNDKTYTYSSASQEFGIAEGTIRARLHHGWTPEEACGLVPRAKQLAIQRVSKAALEREAKRDARRVELLGVRGTYKELAELLGVCRARAYARHKNLGWQLHEAFAPEHIRLSTGAPKLLKAMDEYVSSCLAAKGLERPITL